jgi:catalase
MCVNGNGGSTPNYEPNSYQKPVNTAMRKGPVISAGAECKRYHMKLTDDDFVQAGNLYKIQQADAKSRMIKNVAGHLGNAKPHIRKRQIAHFKKANNELGIGIEKAIAGKMGSKM